LYQTSTSPATPKVVVMLPLVGLVQKGWMATPGLVETNSPPVESVPSVKLKGVARAQLLGLTGPAAPTKPSGATFDPRRLAKVLLLSPESWFNWKM
jgi:hypothetical protein